MGLELMGDDDRLVGLAGALPLRLLAERTGLRAGLSGAMRRQGFDPVYDRGQVLIDLALMLILGGEAISDFQGLRHLVPVIGPVPSTPTVWRAVGEAGDLQLARVNAAVTRFRRYWWGQLAGRPEGFPWLKVAGRELTGITVVDLDATIVQAVSAKENARATYKGGVGFAPNLATCDNVDDVLAVDPRPGTRRRTAGRTILPCWTWRSPGCRARSGTGCWSAWTGRGSPMTCWSTSPQAPGNRAGTGSFPWAGHVPTGRSTPSTGHPGAFGSPRSARMATSWPARSPPT